MPLHQDAIVVDGVIVANFGREVFQAMKDGGLTAANCTCCLWEDFPTTMRAIARWKGWFVEHADLITQVHTAADIGRAKREGKVGIILGWQNTSGFGDYLPFVRVCKDLGVGIVQLTYNTANAVGSGCYETNDGGLTDFGRELVHEMNRAGILIDVSHVGARTAHDAIAWSKQPVAYSHCLPSALKAHPRNKSDEQLRFIAERGGFVGVTLFGPFLRNSSGATLDDVLEAAEYVLNLCGEEQVGIATDFNQGHGDAFIEYANRDKGHGRPTTSFGEVVMPEGMRRIEDWPNLTAAMEMRGWKEDRIRRVVGGNWVRVLREVWGG